MAEDTTTTTTTLAPAKPSEAQVAKDAPVLGEDEQTTDALLNGARGEAMANHREAHTGDEA